MCETKISRSRIASGALIATLALLAAASCAQADELSELRADSQLLQQRLDQIDRSRAASANAATADGVAAGAFPRAFLLPGTDTSVTVGGDIDENFGYRASPSGR